MRLNVMNDNRCGGCTACCTNMGVHELGKPYGYPCDHMIDGGCGIYSDRPRSCRQFQCLWLRGFLGESDKWRPDRCGVVFALEESGSVPWLFAYQCGEQITTETLRYLGDKLLSHRKLRDYGLDRVWFHSAGDFVPGAFEVHPDYPEEYHREKPLRVRATEVGRVMMLHRTKPVHELEAEIETEDWMTPTGEHNEHSYKSRA